MGNKVRAATVVGPGKLEIREYERPKIKPGWLLQKVQMCGICGTDIHFLDNPRIFPWAEETKYPFILGHEFVGTIEEADRDFEMIDVNGEELKIGNRIVAFPVMGSCGKCYFCKILLQPALCMHPPLGYEPPLLTGGCAEICCVLPGSSIYRVPDSMPSEVAALTEPFSTAIRAFERAFQPGMADRGQGMGPGKVVVIQGSGPIGILCVIMSKLCGAGKTIVVGAPRFRLDLCKKFGADEVINIEEITDSLKRVKIIKDMTPHSIGADLVIEVAGVPGAFREGMEIVRRGGTLIEAGHWTDRGEVKINPLILCQKDINLFGSCGYGPGEWGTALRIMERYNKQIPFEDVVTHRFPLENIMEAIDLFRSGNTLKPVIELS